MSKSCARFCDDPPRQPRNLDPYTGESIPSHEGESTEL